MSQQPPTPPPGFYPYPPQQPPKKKHTGRTVLITLSAVFVVLIGAIAGCTVLVMGGGSDGSGGNDNGAPPPLGSGKQQAQKKGAAAPTKQKAHAASKPTVTFRVEGTASSVDTTYGSDSDNRQAPDKVPWQTTLSRDDSGDTLNYFVNAQLNGGGDITCEVLVGSKVVATGHASGSYNICSAQVGQDPFTDKWEKE
ncbi:hypothetical protein AB0I55_00870 [Actinocatenispora sera]|uniref:hypothetical protein n=1 Tax=Actinocatenispora sera TaxID=390989 RepID=UPI00340319A6